MSQITDDNRAIILASGSPRRLRLMRRLGFEPEVIVSNIPEEQGPGESATDYTRRLAHAKAEDVRQRLEDGDTGPDWILAADTIVILDGDVLEKPVDGDEAADMLRRMSGREHVVDTAFCWLQRSTGRHSVCSVDARVRFRELSEEHIARYIATGEPFDKAGSYGIQDQAGAFVRSIEGSHFAIVGLPVCEVVKELEKLDALAGFPFRQTPQA